MIDAVLVIAARTGDTATFDAMLAEAKATKDSLDRRNLTVALLSFDDPLLARRGMGLLLDPAFDIRETGTALWYAHNSVPPRRDAHEFIAANFDAMAKQVTRDEPGFWPYFAEGLCSEKDRADIEAFWRDRIGNYAGGERTLKKALESIQQCATLRAAQEPAVAAFLSKP